ncbi:MAG: hypothetical protein SNG27_07655 [Rikenellaceae bacterium]
MKNLIEVHNAKESKKQKVEAIESFKALIAQRENDPMASESGTKVLRDRVAEIEATL